MNGKEFYEEFKDALDYLGVGFHGMADTNIANGSVVHMTANGRECIIKADQNTTEGLYKAIETAAIMRAKEIVDGWGKTASDYGFTEDAEQFAAVSREILALIPQDGRTQLEQKCMEAADAALRSEGIHCGANDLHAIVIDVIGEKL